MLLECYIDSKSHQNSKPYPCGALAPWFCLFAYAQPAKLRLRKPLAVFFAQNDRLIVCFRYAFVSGRRQSNLASLSSKFASQKLPLPYRLIFSFSGCRGRHPLPQNFIIFRRGGAIFAKQIRHGAKRNLFRRPFLCSITVRFGRVAPTVNHTILLLKREVAPCKGLFHSAFCTLHSALYPLCSVLVSSKINKNIDNFLFLCYNKFRNSEKIKFAFAKIIFSQLRKIEA